VKTLRELIEYLEAGIDRAESDDWCVLSLNVKDAKELLPGLCAALNPEAPDA